MGLRPKLATPTRPFWRQLETFCEGRHGPIDPYNEDTWVAIETPHGMAYAVIDGVTPTRGGFYGNYGFTGRTAGQWAGQAVKDVLRGCLAVGTPEPSLLLESLWGAWQSLRADKGIPPQEVLGAVFCLLHPTADGRHELWRLGDCRWGYALADGTWVDSLGSGLEANSHHAEVRAAAIMAAMTERGLGADYVAVLRDQTPYERETLLAKLYAVGHTAMQAVRQAERGDQWCDSLKGLETLWHAPVTVPADAVRLVLASDGWLGVPRSLAHGHAALRQLAMIDPLVVGFSPEGVKSSKGFVDPHGQLLLPAFDDRALMVLRRR